MPSPRPRVVTGVLPRLQHSQPPSTQQQQPWRRFASTTPPRPTPPPSAHANFYKTFTRPVAKVFLMAVLTYQITYWTWLKLETDDVRSGRQAEISRLEERVKVLQEQVLSQEKATGRK